MNIVRDLRYAFRSLARSPLFTSVALLSIDIIGVVKESKYTGVRDEIPLRSSSPSWRTTPPGAR